MPQAVAHILVPLILVALFKDIYNSRTGKRFSLKYALIAGLAGILPDLDIALFWVLHFFGYTIEQVHRTYTHSLILPIIFLALFAITFKSEKRWWRDIKPSLFFLMIAIGSLIHFILDATLQGYIQPFYPLSTLEIGLNLFGYLPPELGKIVAPSLDAALLVIWLLYLQLKHKISDYI